MSELELPKVHLAPLSYIDIGDRLRDIDPAEVDRLRKSIKEVGLQNPIVIRPARQVNPKDKTKWLPGKKVDGYILVSGGHRYAAARWLGWAEIPAIIVDPETPLAARMLEIDENLYRHELNPLDRSAFLAERKAIYEELHPETKAGVAGGKARHGSANETIAFADATAEKIGLSKRLIQMAVSIHSGLCPDVRQRIKGTWIAKKQNVLLQLARIDRERQGQIVDLMLRAENPIKSVADCKLALEGKFARTESAAETARRKLFKAWEKAPTSVRFEFIQMLAAEGIEIPYRDKREAA